MSELILIVGPMKGCKSLELIKQCSKYFYGELPFALFQSVLNERDENVQSRTGAVLQAQKVKSLAPALEMGLHAVGIDEIHLFEDSDADIVSELLKRKVKVIAAGLDLDYRGLMQPVTKRLYELGANVKSCTAVCHKCKSLDAVYTQIFTKEGNKPVIGGLPPRVPQSEAGKYNYEPACRTCFVQDKSAHDSETVVVKE